jgi:hypothetical protein
MFPWHGGVAPDGQQCGVIVDFDEWVARTFDPDAEDIWGLTPAIEVEYLTRLLADVTGPLEAVTDDEIGIGLWSIADSGGAATMLALGDTSVPLEERLACLDLVRNLYDELFAPRCSATLGHLSEDGGRLNLTCYMLWDIAAYGGDLGTAEGERIEETAIGVMEHALSMPHPACQESGLHGLGHRVARLPERVEPVIDRWLRAEAAADERLVAYAHAARTGCIQ